MTIPENAKQAAVTVIMIAVFGWSAVTLSSALARFYRTWGTIRGTDLHAKRAVLLGDPAVFAMLCNRIIPEGARIVFLTNAASNTASAGLRIHYLMLPRKLYIPNTSAPCPETPPDPAAIIPVVPAGRGIEWLVYRYPVPFGINRVVRISNGRAIHAWDLNIGGNSYERIF